jgi:hypothetical protein
MNDIDEDIDDEIPNITRFSAIDIDNDNDIDIDEDVFNEFHIRSKVGEGDVHVIPNDKLKVDIDIDNNIDNDNNDTSNDPIVSIDTNEIHSNKDIDRDYIKDSNSDIDRDIIDRDTRKDDKNVINRYTYGDIDIDEDIDNKEEINFSGEINDNGKVNIDNGKVNNDIDKDTIHKDIDVSLPILNNFEELDKECIDKNTINISWINKYEGLSMYLCIYLSIYLSVYLTIYLSI